MAITETFYAYAEDRGSIPEANSWYDSLEDAQSDAENDLNAPYGDDDSIVFEITIRPLYKAVKRVDWERV